MHSDASELRTTGRAGAILDRITGTIATIVPIVAVAPAAIQRSCWRCTPRASRKRSTTLTSAATMLKTNNATPTQDATSAVRPATLPNASGLSIGDSSGGPATRVPAATTRIGPTAAAATTGQRRERSRPSGISSSAG